MRIVAGAQAQRVRWAAPARTWVLAAALAMITSAAPLRADTRGFVIAGLYTATYPHKQNCRNGAKSPPEVEEFVLMGMGYSRDEISDIRLNQKDRAGTPREEIMRRRGINGSSVDVGSDPARSADPGFELMNGPFAPGFDLDGNPATGFTDPYTGQRGADHQVLRALGCFGTWDVAWPVKPFTDEVAWDVMLDTLPAWLISVSGEDLQRDGEIELRFATATQHPRRNASGGTLADATFVIQPGSRSFGTFRGRIRDGVITLDPGELELEGEIPYFPVLRLKDARAYFRLMPDGSMDGFIGGYQPWIDIVYYAATNAGLQADTAGIYHNLKKVADAGPDPRTGENTLVSVTYRVLAVPAFLATLDRKLLARGGGIPRPGEPLLPLAEAVPPPSPPRAAESRRGPAIP